MGFIHDSVLNKRPMSATASTVMDLGNSSVYALQVVVEASPTAKTFDSAASASLVVGDLTFSAVSPGSEGNSITLALIVGGTAGAEVVSVVGNAISVSIESTVSTATQVKAAYDASAASVALATVAISGTAGNAQSAATVAPLAGGVTSEIDLTLDTVSIPTHGMYTGLKVQASTTGALPTGLAVTTDYWVIKLGVSSIALASSLSNADAGTKINLTAEGTGVHTLTSTAGVLSHSLQLQKSNDILNWTNEGSATAISTTGSTWFESADKGYRFIRLVNTVTTGQALYSAALVGK